MDHLSFSSFVFLSIFSPPPDHHALGAPPTPPHPAPAPSIRVSTGGMLGGSSFGAGKPGLSSGTELESNLERNPPHTPGAQGSCAGHQRAPGSQTSARLGPLLGARQASGGRGGAGLDLALPLVGAWPARTPPPGSPGGLPADKLCPPPPPRAGTSSRPEAVYARTREICIGAPRGGVSWAEAGPGLQAAGRPPGASQRG